MEAEAFIACIGIGPSSSSSSPSKPSSPSSSTAGIHLHSFTPAALPLSHFSSSPSTPTSSACLLSTPQGGRSASYVASITAGKPSVQIFSWGKSSPISISATPEMLTTLCTDEEGCFWLAGSASGTCFAWEVSTGKLLRTWKAHYRAVSASCYCPTSDYFISGGKDGIINVWRLADICTDTSTSSSNSNSNSNFNSKSSQHRNSIEPIVSWAQHTLTVTMVSGFGAGRVVSASADTTLRMWNVAMGTAGCTQMISMPCALKCAVVDPLERWAFAGGADGNVYIRVMREVAVGEDGKSIAMGRHGAEVTALALNSSGLLLVSGAKDGSVKVWDVTARQVVKILKYEGTVVQLLSAWAPPRDVKGRFKEAKQELPPIRPLLKYKDAQDKPASERTNWVQVPWVERSGPEEEKSLQLDWANSAMDIGLRAAADGNGGGLEVERLQSAIATLQAENDRWQEASARLYSMAVDKAMR